MAEQSLKDKTVKGTFWSAADSLLGNGITFLVGIILARILTPDEYGLVGIVMIIVTVLNSIVDSGFGRALIRNIKADDTDYSTAFFTNLVISVVLYIILFVSAPWIASFFSRPELVALTKVTGLVIIINALSLIQNTILTKRIDFKTKTKASLLSAIASGVVGIGMAFSGFGVWALVGQTISRQLLYTVCLWIFNKWLPLLKFSWKSFNEMWGFGWKLLVSNLIDTIWNELYQVVIGKFYSPATLGQYTRGNQFASIFSQNLTAVVQRVSYPALSEIQEDLPRLKNAYRRVIKMTMFVTTILMFGLGAISEPLLYCLVGPQWGEAASYLPILCVTMSLYPLHAINLNLLQVQGRSDLFLKLEIFKKAIAIVPIVLGILTNIYWMLYSGIVVGVVAFFLNSLYSGRFIGYSSFDQIRDVAPFYGIATVVAVLVYFMKYLGLSYYVVLPLQILIGAFVFFLLCKLFNIEEIDEALSISKQYISKIFHTSK